VVVYPYRRTVYEAFTDQFGKAGAAGVWSASAREHVAGGNRV
jgi:hypothetical protein